MARVAAGAAFTGTVGPGTVPIQGAPNVAPRPSSATAGALFGAETRRAKMIAAGLFVALVLIHSRKGD